MPVNQKTFSRIADGVKKFQPLIDSAKSRDINESDTVVLLIGILSEVLGYDRYTEVTTEKAYKGTYCDLALKVNDKIEILIEAKAVGIELKDAHIKQAVDYASNGGLDWVILTNGINWKVYKMIFAKPVQSILAYEFNFLELKHKNEEDLERLALFSREAIHKNALGDFFEQRQATNRFMLGNLLFEEGVLNQIRKELKQVYPDLKVSKEEIAKIIANEVVKREVLESEESNEAKKKIAKANRKVVKQKGERAKEETISPVIEASEETQPQQ